MIIRIYCENLDVNNPQISEENKHYLLHVLRIKNGDEICIFNNKIQGKYEVLIVKKNITFKLLETNENMENIPEIELASGIVKGDKMSEIINNGVQLGITKFTPLLTQNCHIRNVNLERLEGVAQSALQQSGGMILPIICEIVKIDEYLNKIDQSSLIIYGDLSEKAINVPELFNKIQNIDFEKIVVISGPEGGLINDEILNLSNKSMAFGVKIGSRTMRAENAITSLLTVANLCFDFKNEKNFKKNG